MREISPPESFPLVTEPATISSIAVIVVNYGTADLAVEAVDSVLVRHHGSRQVEVHLVDNASPGDDADRFRTEHVERGWGSWVTLHLEAVNHGFGRGNNIVLEELLDRPDGPDAVFLLNPDARLENEAIDLLAQRLEADAGLGFAGAGISLPDGTAVTAAFRFPSIPGEFSQALAFGPVARAMARWQVPLPPDLAESDVDWVAGAAVMMRTEMLRQIGTFDPGFFLYFEEVDLMRRGALGGWRCRYVPEARVVHVEGASTDVKSGRPELKRHPSYRYHSWSRYFVKTHGRLGAGMAAAAALIGSAGHQVIARLRRRPPGTVPHFFPDFWTHAARPILAPDRSEDGAGR